MVNGEDSEGGGEGKWGGGRGGDGAAARGGEGRGEGDSRDGCAGLGCRAGCGARRPVNPPTDCLRCGVCCFSNLETYVRVTGDDWARLGDAAGQVAHFIGQRAYMKMNAGHCAALEVRRTPDNGAEFFCTIYDRRPQVCRDLERGSPQCEGERAAKGGRVPD